MATRTTNYDLYKPDATDNFSDFREEFNDNMEIIDQNLGGGGGSGGHTIIDENGQTMTQRTGLEFTGNVQVTDDSVNDKTIVDILGGGGNVYGVFIDTSRVVYSSFVFDSSAHTWTATEDCILTDNMSPPDSTTAYFIRIDGKQVFAGYSTVEDPFVYVKKGQVVEYRAKSGSTMKAYAIQQGTNGIFAPVIYSDEERCIGVWRDNKPLYQRILTLTQDTTLVADTWVKTEFNKDTMETLVRVDVTIGTTGAVIEALSGGFIDGKLALNSARNVGFNVSENARIIVQYTKTTDVAGSGNWNTDGVPTHHYSTSEQVIGTWVDGKPLYEKCFTYSSASFSNQQMTLANDLSNVDYVVNYGGCAKEPRDNRNVPIPYMRKSWNECLILQVMQLPGGTVSTAICTNDSWYTSLENIKIWVQYTKASD